MPPPPPSIPRFASSPYLNRLPSSLLLPFIEDCPEDNGCGGVKSNRLRRRGTERRRKGTSLLKYLRHARNIHSRVRSLLCQSLLSFRVRSLPSLPNFDQRTECWLVVRPYLPTPSHCRHAQRPSTDRPSFKLSYPFFSHAFFRLRSKSENFLRAVDRGEPPIDLKDMSVNVTSQVFKDDN